MPDCSRWKHLLRRWAANDSESENFNVERRNAKPQNLKGKAKKEVKKGRCSSFYDTPFGRGAKLLDYFIPHNDTTITTLYLIDNQNDML